VYVFDTSSLRVLRNYYPTRFVTLWQHVEAAVSSQLIVSTRECRRELLEQLAEQWLIDWVKKNTSVFWVPTANETILVADILAVPHFQALVSEKQRLQGKPAADPFVVACAAMHDRTVVTEEKLKPNAAKIPNVCAHYQVRCVNLEEFMHENDWSF
jgi:hypothetical protein